MLIHFKTSIKTSLLLLMFIAGSNIIYAGNRCLSNPVQHQFHTPGIIKTNYYPTEIVPYTDTLETKTSTKAASQTNNFILPDSLAGKSIYFQVNSEITYFIFNHFVKSESKKMFYQAWIKDAELKKVTHQTDSLRKIYTVSFGEKKDEIANLILKYEDRSMTLNQEILALNQSARENEDLYWKTCPASEKNKFQEKIILFRDSLSQVKIKEETEKASKIKIDSLLVSRDSKEKQAKTETIPTIVYKIQIGAFKGKIPDASAKMIKKLSVLRKVENYTDEKGLKIYTTGNLKTYQEAVTMQNQVKQEGVKNPSIIAFQKGKKITVDEAKKLNNEL